MITCYKCRTEVTDSPLENTYKNIIKYQEPQSYWLFP